MALVNFFLAVIFALYGSYIGPVVGSECTISAQVGYGLVGSMIIDEGSGVSYDKPRTRQVENSTWAEIKGLYRP